MNTVKTLVGVLIKSFHFSNRQLVVFSQKNLANFNITGSTLRKGLTILSDKGILTQTENVYSFPDVFFKKWLECF